MTSKELLIISTKSVAPVRLPELPVRTSFQSPSSTSIMAAGSSSSSSFSSTFASFGFLGQSFAMWPG